MRSLVLKHLWSCEDTIYGSDKATVRHRYHFNNRYHILRNTKFKGNELLCTFFGEMNYVTKQHFPFHVWKNRLYRWYNSLWKQCYNSTFMSLRYFISLLTIWEARTVEYSGLLGALLRHHNSVVWLKAGPQTLPKRNPHRVYSFNFQHPHLFLSSSRSCLHLLARLTVTSYLPPIFPLITCFRRQFLRKIWPITLDFLRFTVCRIFLSSSTLYNSSFLTRSAQMTIAILFQQNISKLPRNF